MSDVTRLYPFALRSRVVVTGRPALRANRRNLHFLIVTEDITAEGRDAAITEFSHVPVVQLHRAEETAALFGRADVRVIGFLRSAISQSIYAELKPHRIATPSVRLKGRGRGKSRDKGKGKKKKRRGPDKNKGRPRRLTERSEP